MCVCVGVFVSERQGAAVLPVEGPGHMLANGALPRGRQLARLDLGLVLRHVARPRSARALPALVLLPARPPGVAVPVRAAQLSPRGAAARETRRLAALPARRLALPGPAVRQRPVEASRAARAHQLTRPRPRHAV